MFCSTKQWWCGRQLERGPKQPWSYDLLDFILPSFSFLTSQVLQLSNPTPFPKEITCPCLSLPYWPLLCWLYILTCYLKYHCSDNLSLSHQLTSYQQLLIRKALMFSVAVICSFHVVVLLVLSQSEWVIFTCISLFLLFVKSWHSFCFYLVDGTTGQD